MRRRQARRSIALLALAVLLPLGAGAEEWAQIGSRYQAMGGAAVAVADDVHAAYWNPGALAFEPAQEVSLTAGAMLGAEGDVIRRLESLAAAVDQAAVSIEQLREAVVEGRSLEEAELGRALDFLLRQLPSLDQDGEGLIGGLQAGLGARHGRIALTSYAIGFYAADPVVDRQNIGFTADIDDLFASPPAGRDFSGEPALQTVAADLSMAAGIGQEQAEELVFLADAALGDLESRPEAQALLTDFAIANDNGGTFDENASGALVRGVQTVEVGLAYGHLVPELPFLAWLSGRLGVGAHLRYIRGITVNSGVVIEGADDIFDELTRFEGRRGSNGWGLDLGFKLKVLEWLDAGLVARNVNSPSFDALPNVIDGKYQFTLDPQVRMGFAARPGERWIVSLDLDLTRNDSELIEGYDSRMLALGTEYRWPVGKLDLALRGGLYSNLAEGERAPVLTAGLGLRFWHLALDLTGAMGTRFEEVEVLGSSLPTRAAFATTLAFRRTL